jgi:hypothetical protein
MSNTERQRRFRERNPGYYQRLHAKRRAEVEALYQQQLRERAIARIIAPPVPPMPPPERPPERPPVPLCLPAPEQVTQSWADRLIAEIQSARAGSRIG